MRNREFDRGQDDLRERKGFQPPRPPGRREIMDEMRYTISVFMSDIAKRRFLIILTVALIIVPGRVFSDSASLGYLNMVLGWNERAADKSIERLSTGRILLTDDPASYAIDQTLEKYIHGLDRIVANQTDMVSYYRVMETYVGSMTESLQRIHELAVQRTGGILSDEDREMIDLEIAQQYDLILDNLNQAEFNGKKLFGDLWNNGLIRSNFTQPGYFQAGNVEGLMRFFNKERAAIGALMERLESQSSAEMIARENMAGAQSRQDIDYGFESSRFKKEQLLMLANLLMLGMTRSP
jgi:flagellin-like hook-associated protein FlgL